MNCSEFLLERLCLIFSEENQTTKNCLKKSVLLWIIYKIGKNKFTNQTEKRQEVIKEFSFKEGYT
nr:MAG TPA: hypothetical protein [Caudoviricetes sp.]DAN39422.1 MAG TPA: hypothetical protein [Caudoviricetes sp.]